MKLATLVDGSRDGRLLIVRADLERAVMAETVHTLQAALDDWAEVAPKLAHEADALARHAREDAFAFDANHLMAPLPRAYQWADGSAYVNHVALVRQARGAEMPESFWTEPLMYQGGSDVFLGPREPIVMAEESWGIDFEAEVAVILDDVPMGATPQQAAEAIRLVLLVNDVSLRNLIPGELAKGFGFFQSKPSCAASPVAVTPDDLGEAWDGGKLNLPMLVSLNGEPFGKAEAGEDMTFDFPALIAHAARTRRLSAGTIVGSGTVSNRDAEGGPGKPVAEGGRGYSCIAEQRTVETILHGEAKTPFLRFGDTVRIEMLDREGRSIFGRIEQRVAKG
ncbi:fumarylacetoacetate hydrolase family protein [Pelagibius sp. CAU 1746]|uniref:fumarylacetoacetate hydrolase family protein n=1 Tax=Pelagibius sp. CAU 1746 TaxID=3140370 RepID=UPI00325B507E